jgi:hypothetical protein
VAGLCQEHPAASAIVRAPALRVVAALVIAVRTMAAARIRARAGVIEACRSAILMENLAMSLALLTRANGGL